MKLLDQTVRLFTPEDAETAAQQLRAGDSDWTYTVTHDPAGTGWSFITIYDEDGEYVGKV